MKPWPLLALLIIPLAIAQDYPFDASLYDSHDLSVQFTMQSNVTLSGLGLADKLEASVAYVPEEAGSIEASPKPVSTSPLVFSWKDVGSGTYPFSFTTVVQNSVNKPRITKAIPYPFQSPAEVSQYLQSQEITDTNTAIQSKASELASGKTDTIEVVFSIAQWVQQNVEYDLNTVTAQASQKSSWVMKNRYGVCDELTSLFISLAREAGIPARFVSGIAYTNLPGFPDHWGPHGWAEVWLPDNGWVPVDVTYGQVLYVDATHIVIRKGADSKSTAIDYSLLARSMSMQPGELQTNAVVLDKSGSIEEELQKKVTALYTKSGSNSGNTITATITNPKSYYISTELYLATTSDTKLLDKRQQTILLSPKSTRKVTWRMTMPTFNPGFEYTIPFTVIAQNAGNETVNLQGNTHYDTYPIPPKEEVIQTLLVECDQVPALYVGESGSVTCTSPDAMLCAASCAKNTLSLSFTAAQAGAFPTMVKATSGSDSGSAVVTFVVTNKPSPSISATLPTSTTMDETLTLVLKVDSEAITDALITVNAKHFNQNWTLDQLESKQFELRFPATYLDAGENTIAISVQGEDKNGELVQKSSEAMITLQATFLERVQLFLMHLFD